MRKPRCRQIRGVCRWTGTVTTLLLVVILVGSAWGVAPGVAVTRSLDIFITAGRLSVETYANPRTQNSVPYVPYFMVQGRGSRWPQLEWGFDAIAFAQELGVISNQVLIPLWAIVLLTGLPTYWLWRRDRKRPGLCGTCGYDLRGAAHKVCPECGSALTKGRR